MPPLTIELALLTSWVGRTDPTVVDPVLPTNTGRIEFRQTKIHGLSYIARNGDALVDSDDQGFEAKLRLGDSNVKVSSSMTIQLGALIHNQYDMEAEVGDIDVQFATSVDSDGNFELKDFKIDQLEHVKVTLHGVTIIDKLTEQIVGVISELFIAFFNGEARKMISDTIRPMMANELKHLRPH